MVQLDGGACSLLGWCTPWDVCSELLRVIRGNSGLGLRVKSESERSSYVEQVVLILDLQLLLRVLAQHHSLFPTKIVS